MPRSANPRFQLQEGFGFQAISRTFTGLVRCCAWVCFAEFNRLLEEQMDAISQSVQLIQAAIKTHARLSPCLAGDHCEPQYGYLHYHESSHERLRWATEVTGQSEAASQACGEERTRQRASRGGDEFAEGFKSPQIMAQRVVALFLLSESFFLSSNTSSRDSIH